MMLSEENCTVKGEVHGLPKARNYVVTASNFNLRGGHRPSNCFLEICSAIGVIPMGVRRSSFKE